MPDRSQHPTIPPGFDYITPYLQKFLRRFPHVDQNVFVMMPFSTANSQAIFEAIRAELQEHGLVALRADQRTFSSMLWWNVVTYMIGSTYGIVVYEPVSGLSFNPNVSIEAGFMLALDRPVLFLASDELSGLPVDFSGHVFKTYSSKSGCPKSTTREAVKDWIENDLSYYEYQDKKLILFASLGGTCRCVMAKALLADVLHNEKLSGMTVDAAAIADPHHATISPSARKAIGEIGCGQWIEGHRPRKLCPYLQERADLIIVLTDQNLARPTECSGKVVRDRELFGIHVTNPYPDHEDEASLQRYRAVRDMLRHAIAEKLPEIVERVGGTPEISV